MTHKHGVVNLANLSALIAHHFRKIYITWSKLKTFLIKLKVKIVNLKKKLWLICDLCVDNFKKVVTK